MKYLFSWLFACLFAVGCSCDGDYFCDGAEETYVFNTVLFSDFSQAELDSSKLILYSDNNEILETTFIGRFIYKPETSDNYQYNWRLNNSLSNYDLRTYYYVFEVDNIAYTISAFYYEPQDTILNCSFDCNGLTTENFTFYRNFYFRYQGDTIRNEESFIIQK